MKFSLIILLLTVVNFWGFAEKARLIVSTDIGGSDPDDQESLVHLLASLDQVDLEGLIFQNAWVPFNQGNEFVVVDKILTAYGKVWSNFCIHSNGFPKEEEIRNMLKYGQRVAGMKGVGDGQDTPGSEHIIKVVDLPDERPVWIAAWSGLNTLAQALWKVKATRSADEVVDFVKKIRVYDILGQDDAGAWIVKNFPDLLYIRNKEVYGWGPNDEWIRDNVQCKGLLGLEYPDRIWASEGDSPSFMYVLENGLNNPEHLDWGSWGGRFDTKQVVSIRSMDWVEKNGLDEKAYDPYYMIGSAKEGCLAINKWQTDILNDFAARMLWSCVSSYEDANHHPVISFKGDTSKDAVYLTARKGVNITLDAMGSYDPDGDSLYYEWIYYVEPSTYKQTLNWEEKGAVLNFNIPDDAGNTTLHIILRLTDNGTPALSSYKRFIINCVE